MTTEVQYHCNDTAHLELANSLQSAQAESEQFRTKYRLAVDFIRSLNVALNEQADRSEWCGEYDRLIEHFWDSNMPSELGIERIQRSREYTVEITVTGFMTTTTQFTVEASSQEEAEDRASDYINTELNSDDLLTREAQSRLFFDVQCEINSTYLS